MYNLFLLKKQVSSTERCLIHFILYSIILDNSYLISAISRLSLCDSLHEKFRKNVSRDEKHLPGNNANSCVC